MATNIRFDPAFFKNANATELVNLIREQATTQQAPSRDTAMAEAEGLTLGAIRDFEQTVLPEILAAQEGAGASGGALTALMAQEAAAASGAKVAERQLAHVEKTDVLAGQERGQDLNALLGLLQDTTTRDINRQDTIAKLMMGLQSAGTRGGSRFDTVGSKDTGQGGPLLSSPERWAGPASTTKSKAYARGKY